MSLRIKTGCFSVVEWSTYLMNRFKDTDCPQRIVYPKIEKKIYIRIIIEVWASRFLQRNVGRMPHTFSPLCKNRNSHYNFAVYKRRPLYYGVW